MEALMDALRSAWTRHWVWRTASRLQFYRTVAGFVADGKPLFDTLELIERRWRDKRDPRAQGVAQILALMRGKSASGRALRFAEAVGLFAPSIEAMCIDAGEQSGDPAGGLRMAAELTETAQKIGSTIRGELIYPGFLLLMLVGLLFMLQSAVIPVFSEIAPRYMWPGSAQVLGVLADHALGIAFGLVSIIVGVVVAFRLSRGPWVGAARAVFDRFVPPWSIHKRIAASTFMSTFSAFIRAGVPFSAVVDNMARTATPWEAQWLWQIKQRMRRGVPDAEAMACDLFTDDEQWEISVYGAMSDFATALQALASRITASTLARIQKTMGILRTLIMFAVAGTIIWVYGAFFQVVMLARTAT